MPPGKSRAGRPQNRNSSRSGGAERSMYDAYVKKLANGFYNDITVEIQSGDVFIGSASFVNSPRISGTSLAEIKRNPVRWGILPTRVAVNGVGDFNGTYIIKDIRNVLSKSGGLTTRYALITTDEYIQKGSRMQNAITSILGANFAERFVGMFTFRRSMTIGNTEIAAAIGTDSKKKSGNWIQGAGYIKGGEEVIDPDAKTGLNAKEDWRIRRVFGFGRNFGYELSKEEGALNVAHNAMTENMMMNATDTFTSWNKDTVDIKEKEKEE